MKSHLAFLFSTTLAALVPVAVAQFTTFHWSVGQAIPDGSAVGIANTQALNVPGAAISSLRVNLEITGRGGAAFNGDLYATLVHDSGFSVLLNRPGRRDGDPLGYGDNGLNVTFDDRPGSGDIHLYRLELSGDHYLPLGHALTGSWATDARGVDPGSVLDIHRRNSDLSCFTGLNPNGLWTLYVADLEPGNLAMLTSWGLEMTMVPEPEGSGVLLGLCALVWTIGRRRERR
ncbi:MAG TPA: PEP-CTERM sorting domain-containing protein [Candidatus Paceibacterota bacterium]|nr:PEP-CTERM sorting domain-containing protein [Candidatus Paceibacterota bacterium]